MGKKEMSLQLNCEFATFGICNDTGTYGYK